MVDWIFLMTGHDTMYIFASLLVLDMLPLFNLVPPSSIIADI